MLRPRVSVRAQAAAEGSELPLPQAPPEPDDDGPLPALAEDDAPGTPAAGSAAGSAGQAAATTPAARLQQVPYNFKGGVKGTLGLRDLFGLLGHGLGLLPSEQAYVVDELVLAKEKGAAAKEATTTASKASVFVLFRLPFFSPLISWPRSVALWCANR